MTRRALLASVVAVIAAAPRPKPRPMWVCGNRLPILPLRSAPDFRGAMQTARLRAASRWVTSRWPSA